MPHQVDSDNSTETATVATLCATVKQLEDSGAERFDPVRFRYIKTMLERALQQDEPIGRLLAEKIWGAVKAYQCAYASECAAMKPLLQSLAEREPTMQGQLQALFEAGDFNAIRRTARRVQPPQRTESLTTLTNSLEMRSSSASEVPPGHPQELKALRFYRDALQQQYAQKLISRALMNAPDSAGPLNPQKLALRSLAIMREISPAYLGHFVAYAETLFWLEKQQGS